MRLSIHVLSRGMIRVVFIVIVAGLIDKTVVMNHSFEVVMATLLGFRRIRAHVVWRLLMLWISWLLCLPERLEIIDDE